MSVKSVRKEFFKYVIPSIAGMLVVSLDILADGIFVGRGLGPHALAAVNLVSPILSIIAASAVFLSVGGATLASICLGQGRDDEANVIFNKSFVMVIVSTGAI